VRVIASELGLGVDFILGWLLAERRLLADNVCRNVGICVFLEAKTN